MRTVAFWVAEKSQHHIADVHMIISNLLSFSGQVQTLMKSLEKCWRHSSLLKGWSEEAAKLLLPNTWAGQI